MFSITSANSRNAFWIWVRLSLLLSCKELNIDSTFKRRSSRLRPPSSTVPCPALTLFRLVSTRPPISSDALAERDASLRTSVATTANPLPCSPARAASTEALSASKLV